MKKTIRKWFWAWDFEKEEKWLDKMAAEGWALCGVGFCRYTFEPCSPGEYAFRLELLENHLNDEKSKDYIGFVEETGAEMVGSYLRWVYFRKKTAEGPFELFSDAHSKIAHLGRIKWLTGFLALLNLPIGFSNLVNFAFHGYALSSVGFLNIAVCGLLLYGWLSLHKMQASLRQQSEMFE